MIEYFGPNVHLPFRHKDEIFHGIVFFIFFSVTLGTIKYLREKIPGVNFKLADKGGIFYRSLN